MSIVNTISLESLNKMEIAMTFGELREILSELEDLRNYAKIMNYKPKGEEEMNTAVIVFLYLSGCTTMYLLLVMVKPDDDHRMNVFAPIVIGFWFLAGPFVFFEAIYKLALFILRGKKP